MRHRLTGNSEAPSTVDSSGSYTTTEAIYRTYLHTYIHIENIIAVIPSIAHCQASECALCIHGSIDRWMDSVPNRCEVVFTVYNVCVPKHSTARHRVLYVCTA